MDKADRKMKGNRIFKTDAFIIICFLLYTLLVLYETLFSRNHYNAPLGKLWEGWIIVENKNGITDYNCVENFLMLLPFGFLLSDLFHVVSETINDKKILKKVTLISFFFSLFIESMQLIFSIGAFQFSDLFYNTFGGLAGAWLSLKLHQFLVNHNKRQ